MHFVPQHRAADGRGVMIHLLHRRSLRIEVFEFGLFALNRRLAFIDLAVEIKIFLVGRGQFRAAIANFFFGRGDHRGQRLALQRPGFNLGIYRR